MTTVTLILDDNGGTEKGVIRIPNSDCNLVVVIPVGTIFHSKDTVILTNHPQNDEKGILEKKHYSVMEDYSILIKITTPGVWSFQLKMNDQLGPLIRFITETDVIINKKSVPINSLIIQTNYARCVGKVTEWLDNLRPISELGYNMIHFPPIQEPGSRSHYSLRDQMAASRDLFPPGFPENERWPLIETTMKEIETKLDLGFMIDIVLNHTHNLTHWLNDHPESGYNEITAPWLNPAMFIDDFFREISEKIGDGNAISIQPVFPKENLPVFRDFLYNELHKSDFQRFFVLNSSKSLSDLKESIGKPLPKAFEMIRMRSINYSSPQRLNVLRSKGIINNGSYSMDSLCIDTHYASALYSPPGDDNDLLIDDFEMAINTINAPLLQQYSSLCKEIVDNVIREFGYHRYEGDHKGTPISVKVPIVCRYFQKIVIHNGETLHFACNGWLMSDNPRNDFTAKGSDVYLKRKLVSWGDCLKLRFGETRDDNPWLWDYMSDYVRHVAKISHAIRIDNAHSTPLALAAHCIKCAREINPNLFVMAELFTSGEDEDIEVINSIGINAFMREAIHRLTPNSMSWLLRQSGGTFLAAVDSIDSTYVISPKRQIPALIFDITHDNKITNDNRLLMIAPASMAVSPIASTRGFDDFLSFNPSVVSEYRKYPNNENLNGLHPIRKILNKLHKEMASEGYNELSTKVFGSYLSIVRSNLSKGFGIWMIVKFEKSDEYTYDQRIPCPFPPVSLVFESKINDFHLSSEMDPGYCNLYLNAQIDKLTTCKIDGNDLVLNDFHPGFVVCFRTRLQKEVISTMSNLDFRSLSNGFDSSMRGLTLVDFNTLMYRCENEEKVSHNGGTYSFNDYGSCFYAGIMGILGALNTASRSPQGMAHSVFENIRQGNWLIDYIYSRVSRQSSLSVFVSYLRSVFDKLFKLPRDIMPKFVDRIIQSIVYAFRERASSLMTSFIQKGDDFVKSLCHSSIAFYGHISDCQLIHPSLISYFCKNVFRFDSCLAAGLPYCSTGNMRSWGRDTFISMRGMFLITGRFREARDHIIAYSSCLRHGLIPNQMNGGISPRYNSRDATWWFLQAIQDYDIMSNSKESILETHVPRLFPVDDQKCFFHDMPRPTMKIAEIVQEIFYRHANGIHFTEWDAGETLDPLMNPEGFEMNIFTDWSSGFIFGGNQYNCGTWMDKIGSNSRVGNKSVPSTPRNGAAIEIIGLLSSSLRWIQQKYNEGKYPYAGVSIKNGDQFISWESWRQLIISNFESWFYIPVKPEHDKHYLIEPSHVSVRGIYKDTVGSSNEFPDYQFRPNVLIAITVAPELFDPLHAIRCLNNVEERLLGRIGVCSLDPKDWRYRPEYDPNNDCDDYFSAGGFNFHNGTEWVWLSGYFFRASMRMRRPFSIKMTKMLSSIKGYLLRSKEQGLPSFTNANGHISSFCCPNQATSVSCIIDLLFDYSQYGDDEVVIMNCDDESEI